MPKHLPLFILQHLAGAARLPQGRHPSPPPSPPPHQPRNIDFPSANLRQVLSASSPEPTNQWETRLRPSETNGREDLAGFLVLGTRELLSCSLSSSPPAILEREGLVLPASCGSSAAVEQQPLDTTHHYHPHPLYVKIHKADPSGTLFH